MVTTTVCYMASVVLLMASIYAVDYSARQKIDADLVRLDVQIRLLDGKSITDSVTTSEDATVPDSLPTAPVVSTCVKYQYCYRFYICLCPSVHDADCV